MEKISVICIAYKVAPFIGQCLESICRQTWENLEIILVAGRGADEDETPGIARESAKKDPRIRLVEIEAKTIGNARNQGLKEVTGDYIGFVDGDDYIEPGMFEKLLCNLKKHNADISVCGRIREYGDSSITDPPGELRVLDSKDSFEMLMRGTGFFFHCWDKLFRKELFRDVTFPLDRQVEDRNVIAEVIGRADRVVYEPVPLYHYRVRGDSESRLYIMSEYNADADREFCELVLGKYPELQDLCQSYLMYGHITCVQNYLLYFKGTGRDTEEMRQRYRDHLSWIRRELKKPNPELSGKVRLKAWMSLHARWLLKSLTHKNHVEGTGKR